jgi:hypothetical protein
MNIRDAKALRKASLDISDPQELIARAKAAVRSRGYHPSDFYR